jgi:ubiquinone/menaquinone biosynthesis C-methylase UbiE
MMQQTNPVKFNRVAKTAFAPIYPYLAEQIKNKFGITEGVCVDIGSGPGSLAIAMAKITNLRVFSLDLQAEMSTIARQNFAEEGLEKRIEAVTANVQSMPFADNSVDLAVSRGSIFFWDNKAVAFREINRILKPGGVAYIGGGMGNEQIRAQVMETFARDESLREQHEQFQSMLAKGPAKLNPPEIEKELEQAGATGIVVKENGGIWVEIHKG